MKFFGDYFDNYSNPILEYPIKGSRFRADLKATINGQDWVMEFVSTKKEDFIECAVRLEMWKTYKETYGLKIALHKKLEKQLRILLMNTLNLPNLKKPMHSIIFYSLLVNLPYFVFYECVYSEA